MSASGRQTSITRYAFDADGRLVDRPGGAGCLEWDSLGRLVRVRASEGGAVVATYTYDAVDRLHTVERGGSRIRFRYAGTTAAVTGVVDDVGGGVLRQVVSSADGTVLADRTGAGTDPRTYGTNGHHDVTWIADNSGAVTATARFDPWGTLLRSSGSLPDWRFQGSWHDTATELAYARARWYSHALGSFVSEDTLLGSPETPASRHLLSYAQGDPANGWDPSGTNSLEGYYPFKPNDRERAACATWPSRCGTWKWASAWAAWYGAQSPGPEEFNALRHCIWQCLLTYADGWGWARYWGTIHETGSPPRTVRQRKDRTVDLHNNYVGRLLGQHLGEMGLMKAREAMRLCFGAWNAGYLWTYQFGRIRWSDGRVVPNPTDKW